MYINKKSSAFSPDAVVAALQIWNRTAISLLDVRHNLISPKEALQGYRLPAGTFLFTNGGKAEVMLNETIYNVERFGLLHGGKGTELTITPQCDWLEYYMVMYKAAEPSFRKGEYARLIEQFNPFRQQYGFSPNNPLFFAEELRKMYENWKNPAPLNMFYGKAVFYRFVYEIYRQLAQGQIHTFEPDVVLTAKRFLDHHYQEPVSIHALSEMLGISYSHFHRSFKQQMGKSPQEYLIDMRLAAAMRFLQGGQASIREIAGYCGFQDERNLQRMFSKSLGMTPNAYRQNMSHDMIDGGLGNMIPFSYNRERKVSLNKPEGKGATNMFRQMRTKTFVAVALSLMLLMGACGTEPANGKDTGSTPPSTVASRITGTEATAPVESETRLVSTVMGDVEVPANPQRIVAAGFWVGDILAFGKQPVAIQDFYTKTSPWSEQTKNITVLEKWEPEYIMALEPDLIITGAFGGQVSDYEDLSKIAPTVAFDWNDEPETRLPVMAQVLGLEAADGQALVNEYNQKIEDYRQRLEKTGILDKTITIFRNDGVVEGGLELGSEIGWGGEVVYGLFNMPMPESVTKLKETSEGSITNVSFEVVAELCGDYILMNQNDPELIQQLKENPIWHSIPAVQKDNIVVVEPGKVYFPDIITDTYKLEVISEALLKLAEK